MSSYCITIPVYNEENRIEQGVRTLASFLKSVGGDVRIDIADNGSTDKTIEIAGRLTKEIPRVTLTRVPEKGVGFALRTSWLQATEDIVGYMDVDLSTDLNHFKEVNQLFENSDVDVVNSSRLLPKSRVIGRKLKREITSRGFNFLLRQILNVSTTDGMCGFKFIRRGKFLKLYESGLNRKDWFFNAELVVRAEWAGMKISEIPVTWTDDPHSNVKLYNLSKSYFFSMLQLRREREKG